MPRKKSRFGSLTRSISSLLGLESRGGAVYGSFKCVCCSNNGDDTLTPEELTALLGILAAATAVLIPIITMALGRRKKRNYSTLLSDTILAGYILLFNPASEASGVRSNSVHVFVCRFFSATA